MIYTIIFIVFIIGFVVYFAFDFGADDISDCFAITLLGGLVGLLTASAASLVLVMLTDSMAKTEITRIDSANIQALQDGSSVSGSFFLGSGYIDGEMRYTYMVEDDGGLRMQQVNAENAVLVEDKSPRIETYDERFTNGYVRYWFGDGPAFTSESYRIYAPRGTVKQQFNVDLQ